MPDVDTLRGSLALCAVRARLASQSGDEAERALILEEADAICRRLDCLEREAEWNTLAGSPDHG